MSAEPLVPLARQHAVGDLPRRSAGRLPDKTAIIDGDAHLTFAELDAVTDRVAAGLSAEGIIKGDKIALLSHNCWEFAALAFAAARLGVILVPINFMLGADEIAFILDHSEATTFVVEGPLIDTAAKAMDTGGAVLRRVALRADGALPEGWGNFSTWSSHQGVVPQVQVDDDDPVRLMYTSGTESRPKGVLLSSRALMWQYVSCVIDGSMAADDVELHTLPLYHCAQMDCFLSVDVYLGATSIILPGPDPATILRTIAEQKVTKYFAPPTVWISLLRHPDFETTDLSSLRKGYYGASAMPVEVLKEIRERLPDVELWNFYGQTEMSPLATILGPEEQLTKAGSAGRQAINVETRIVDQEDRTVPSETVGEIVHRSPHATLGYYKNEEKTAEAFRNGWFHSGDLGYLDEDGRLFVVDRLKDMIKSGGENVASREVEEAIYQLEGVAEVAVFGVSHPTWVEAVAAVVVPKPGVTLLPEQVLEHALTVLAGYKAPKYVVVADALPKNPSGKILKRALRDEHADIAQ
ncbi:MAG: AMP-binding protein [Nocardioides sp.]|nr:AMP-binding protein [Nocardioides sp.]